MRAGGLLFCGFAPALGLSEELTQVNKRFSEGRPVDDSAEGRTLQDCAGEHRPGLNASIMLHLGTALRAYYDDDLSSLSVRHVVIDAAVPTEDLDSPPPNPVI